MINRRAARTFIIALTGVIAVCLLCIFFFSPPPIVWGVIAEGDANPQRYQDVAKKITIALMRQFPIGSPAENLRSSLLLQRFDLDCPALQRRTPCLAAWDPFQGKQYDQSATYRWGVFPCGDDVKIIWSTDKAGRITKLEGFYGRSCL
ncbi:MAG TPA: hypothetical protein VGG48_18850 [Rhizomicrobium sp.]|jgi:hypothetical protein